MRVLYEGAVFELMPRGGVARYFTELVNHLPASMEPVVTVPQRTAVTFTHPQTRLEPVRTDAPMRALRSWWRRSQHAKLALQRSLLQPAITHWTYYYGLCRSPMSRDTSQTSSRSTISFMKPFPNSIAAATRSRSSGRRLSGRITSAVSHRRRTTSFAIAIRRRPSGLP